MGTLEWILVVLCVMLALKFWLVLAPLFKGAPKPRKAIRPYRKSASTETRTDHIDIENVTHTLNIPEVQGSKIGVEETKIKTKSSLDALRELKK